MKIAIASMDGQVINQHFGKCGEFRIYQMDEDGDFHFLELRAHKPPCGFGSHSDDALLETAELIADCGVVLAFRIGPPAEQLLTKRGIWALAVYDTVDNALAKLAAYFLKQRQAAFR